jgi:CrcB protein
LLPYLIVFAGAGVGGVLRYLAGTLITERFPVRFPLGTFAVNVTGCFAIGVAVTLLVERWAVHPYWRLFLTVGVLGGYTTFSTFGYDTWILVRARAPLMAAGYVVSSVVAGLLAVMAGVMVAARR